MIDLWPVTVESHPIYGSGILPASHAGTCASRGGRCGWGIFAPVEPNPLFEFDSAEIMKVRKAIEVRCVYCYTRHRIEDVLPDIFVRDICRKLGAIR